MDSGEAMKVVFSRIQALEPDNASKIIGYVLIQEHGEKDMIRLAFGPDVLLLSLIQKAKAHLGISISRPKANSLLHLTLPPQSPLSLSGETPAYFAGFSANPSSSPSYAAVVNGVASRGGNNHVLSSSCTSGNPSNGADEGTTNKTEFLDSSVSNELQNHNLHRRCISLDACVGSEESSSGLEAKQCLFFARGFCKNGVTCRFLHGNVSDFSSPAIESPSEFVQCHELQRSKSSIPPRLIPPAISSLPNFADYFTHYTQRSEFADEFARFGRFRHERNCSSGSRQIYLTFPADSSFREEDVSNYFSNFGPVQDVRIPYQQKRMFGFVTFVYPETVKQILAKGNPHFVCDCRVLVKPYKEKGEMPEKKIRLPHQQSDFLNATLSPLDYDRLEMMRKTEQAELLQAIQLQEKRLMNMQLLDLNKVHNLHPHQAISPGSLASSLFSRRLASQTPNGERFLPEIDESYNNGDSFLPDNLFPSPTRSPEDEPEAPAFQNTSEVLCSSSSTGQERGVTMEHRINGAPAV